MSPTAPAANPVAAVSVASADGLAGGRWAWLPNLPPARNRFVLLRRAFPLRAVPPSLRLRLFVDTRYRLWVNGEIVGHGPARFVPAYPEADTHELAPWLRAGENVIGVEAHHIGDASYEAMPSEPVFFAEGGATGSVDLASPGEWRGIPCEARDPGAPGYSFAQGPVEILDTAALPAGWAAPGFDDTGWPLLNEAAHAGRARPAERSVASPDGRAHRPERIVVAGRLDRTEEVHGFRVDEPVDPEHAEHRLAYATWIHSPREQEVGLGLFWGPHFLNGEALAAEPCTQRGNREDYRLRLRAGWNLLYGEPLPLAGFWGLLIGVPVAAGLFLAARPDLGCPDSLICAGPVGPEKLASARGTAPTDEADLAALPLEWTRWSRHRAPGLPARLMAWDRFANGSRPPEPLTVEDLVLRGGEAAACYDFGGEFLGRVRIELTAPKGTIIDVANAERLRDDGLADLYRGHWGINSADRFVWSGGRGTLEGFHPRGGRYLQVSVRGAGEEKVTLHRVAVRSHAFPLRVEGEFRCSDPLYNWIWDAGLATLRACASDALLDCPWREQGCYVGDVLVEQRVLRMATPDLSLARRSLRLFAQSQRADGQIPDVAPATKSDTLCDYTLLWVVAVAEHLAETGDLTLVREVWPAVERALASPVWREGPSGLWSVADPNARVFGDSALPRALREGENAILNAHRVAALRSAARMATALGERGPEARLAREAIRAEAAFQKLWSPALGRFVARADADVDAETGALHANVLALAHGLTTTPEQARGALAHVEAGLTRTLALEPGRLELFFHHFLLEALRRQGREATIDRVMRLHYGHMRREGAWTLWEYFAANRSHCHAWSASPLPHFIRHVLGVRPESPERPDRLVLDPHPGALDWAEGVYPHPKGPVRVAWRRRGETLVVEARAPAGVTLIRKGRAVERV
jgi:hypothetical protein